MEEKDISMNTQSHEYWKWFVNSERKKKRKELGDLLRELVSEYWDIAWKEGYEDRHHDTPEGDGSMCWHLINEVIEKLEEA